MRALNRLREEVRAEVAAVRIWLFETGMDLQVRKSTIPMPSSPASMLRRQREIELENQAKVQELSDGFSHEELHEARERLVTTTGHRSLPMFRKTWCRRRQRSSSPSATPSPL